MSTKDNNNLIPNGLNNFSSENLLIKMQKGEKKKLVLLQIVNAT